MRAQPTEIILDMNPPRPLKFKQILLTTVKVGTILGDWPVFIRRTKQIKILIRLQIKCLFWYIGLISFFNVRL